MPRNLPSKIQEAVWEVQITSRIFKAGEECMNKSIHNQGKTYEARQTLFKDPASSMTATTARHQQRKKCLTFQSKMTSKYQVTLDIVKTYQIPTSTTWTCHGKMHTGTITLDHKEFLIKMK